MPEGFDLALSVTLPADNPYAGDYTLRLAECTGLDDLDVRRETGVSLVGLFREQGSDPGMMAVVAAVIVWLERRKKFPHTTFKDVARTITWGTDFELRDADEPGEDDPGKAGSGDSPKKTES